jgi:N-acetyl-gamma-glutamyl-phosphate reductase
VTGHRHLPEIEQELNRSAKARGIRINFIPHLVPVNRGIHSTIVAGLRAGVTGADIEASLLAAYASERFVRVLPAGMLADTKHVTFTNVNEIGFAVDEHTGQLVISSAIDNLTKGASGQAVQCMNIMFGLAETSGLV